SRSSNRHSPKTARRATPCGAAISAWPSTSGTASRQPPTSRPSTTSSTSWRVPPSDRFIAAKEHADRVGVSVEIDERHVGAENSADEEGRALIACERGQAELGTQ